jgi:hypothetical protein
MGPVEVTLNELIELLPAFTANSSRPSEVMSSAPGESTIGKPNGGWVARPTPPVDTTLRGLFGDGPISAARKDQDMVAAGDSNHRHTAAQ